MQENLVDQACRLVGAPAARGCSWRGLLRGGLVDPRPVVAVVDPSPLRLVEAVEDDIQPARTGGAESRARGWGWCAKAVRSSRRGSGAKGEQGGPSGLRLAASAYTTSPMYGTGLGPPSSYSTRSSFDTVSPGAAPLRSRDLQLRGRGDEDSPPPPRELEPRPVVVSMPDLSDESIARRQKVAVALGGLSPLAFICGRSRGYRALLRLNDCKARLAPHTCPEASVGGWPAIDLNDAQRSVTTLLCPYRSRWRDLARY